VSTSDQNNFLKSTLAAFFVDDDADDRLLFSYAINDLDVKVHLKTASNGLDALETLKADQSFVPDFIFLDLNMPYMNGKECLAEIKKIPKLQPATIIIYTTSSNKKDMEETKKLGADHYLVKPYDIDNLTFLLKSIFKKESIPFLIQEA
jgi:CheY-like chemotaxis protein